MVAFAWEEGLDIVYCWLCETPQKLEGWRQTAVHIGLGVLDFWLVVAEWAQVDVRFGLGIYSQSFLASQNLGG